MRSFVATDSIGKVDVTVVSSSPRGTVRDVSAVPEISMASPYYGEQLKGIACRGVGGDLRQGLPPSCLICGRYAPNTSAIRFSITDAPLALAASLDDRRLPHASLAPVRVAVVDRRAPVGRRSPTISRASARRSGFSDPTTRFASAASTTRRSRASPVTSARRAPVAIKGGLGFAEDPSRFSIACRQIGPISIDTASCPAKKKSTPPRPQSSSKTPTSIGYSTRSATR